MRTLAERAETLRAALPRHPLLVLRALRFVVRRCRPPHVHPVMPWPSGELRPFRSILSHVMQPLLDSGYDVTKNEDDLRKAARMLKGTSAPVRRMLPEDDDPAQDRS
jgi:hypothetical protein